jgi:Asp-tRNA(Asn)/Glu-tRNA(Gln) amidotransferase A subunit family amidase
MESELNHLGAVEAAGKLARREITAQALLSGCIARIRERDSAVHAFTHVDFDAAMARARALDARPSDGLLHGLPLGVKDVFDTVDMPTSYGSPIYAGHRPASDAASVALARAAGAVVVGKTVTTEFATFHPGPTCNPHDLSCTPGGSSSGSAAAVADFMVPLAFGTQTAGSIVRPAAYCGVIGYKPTFGTVSRVGVKMISDTLDTIGAFARSVPDVALFVAALCGRRDLVIDEAQRDAPRIGLCRTYEWDRAAPETVQLFEAAGRQLRDAGALVRDVTLPRDFAGLAAAQTTVMVHEVAECLAFERLARHDALSAELVQMIGEGIAVPLAEYDAARELARRARAMLPQVFDGLDVLIAPSTPGAAPAGIQATGDPLFNRVWTLLRVPCVHVPARGASHRLPLGVSVVGRLRADRATLLAAEWIHARL